MPRLHTWSKSSSRSCADARRGLRRMVEVARDNGAAGCDSAREGAIPGITEETFAGDQLRPGMAVARERHVSRWDCAESPGGSEITSCAVGCG